MEDNDIEGEDVEMKINNFSEKKIGKNKSEKKNENVDNEIEISEEKDKMNISFLNENLIILCIFSIKIL